MEYQLSVNYKQNQQPFPLELSETIHRELHLSLRRNLLFVQACLTEHSRMQDNHLQFVLSVRRRNIFVAGLFVTDLVPVRSDDFKKPFGFIRMELDRFKFRLAKKFLHQHSVIVKPLGK